MTYALSFVSMSSIVLGLLAPFVPSRLARYARYSGTASRTRTRLSALIRFSRTPERSDSVSVIASVFVVASSLTVLTRR
jgi:hypothetical protein